MPNEIAVREHLARILGSRGFQNSERLCRFLRFTVEAKLRGEAGGIKEYLIGREVFDRDDNYDPRIDPIVRVEARRLRKKLEEFYAVNPLEPGDLRIDFPKGSYAPEFQEAKSPVAAPDAPASKWLGVVLVAGVGMALTAAWYFIAIDRPAQSAPATTVILPARWIWKGEDFPAIAYDEELAEMAAAELANRQAASVVAWPALQKFKGLNLRLPRIAAELGVQRAVIVTVRVEPAGFRVTAFMVDARTDRKVGVYDKVPQVLVTAADRQDAARNLASAILSAKW